MSSAENQSKKIVWESMPESADKGFLERFNYSDSSTSEEVQTVSDILGDIKRLDETIIERTPIINHEVRDTDRRAEILNKLKDILDLDDSE